MFADIAARRDDAGVRTDLLHQFVELEFVAARAMKGKDQRCARCRRFRKCVIGWSCHHLQQTGPLLRSRWRFG